MLPSGAGLTKPIKLVNSRNFWVRANKYEEIFTKLEDYFEKWIVLLDAATKDCWKMEEEKEQRKIN